MSAPCILDTAGRALRGLTHLVLATVLRYRCYKYLPFAHKNKWAKRGEVTFRHTQKQKTEPGCELKHLGSRVCALHHQPELSFKISPKPICFQLYVLLYYKLSILLLSLIQLPKGLSILLPFSKNQALVLLSSCSAFVFYFINFPFHLY